MTKLRVQAAIFDVDETLLDNRVAGGGTTHELSRYEATIQVAKQRGIQQLLTITHEENLAAFVTAKEHSIASAVWNLLYQKGLVNSE